MTTALQQVVVLGSTGSIGVSTLDVIRCHPEKFSVFALTANTSTEKLFQQCLQYKPAYAVMADSMAASELHQRLRASGQSTKVLSGSSALMEVVAFREVDTVMAAIVGAAGLSASLAAAKAGKKILLANKEALVMTGPLFMQAVQQHSATLLPIDSEHNAIFQCLPASHRGLQRDYHAQGVKRVLLTASGGPFRTLSLSELSQVTPEQACAHPNWQMGRKISVDSATMMNKGLEIIEACWLFSLTEQDVEVVIHPQSVIHSLVEYVDGSLLAQMGNPDMRTPIAYGLAWPGRMTSGVSSLDLVSLRKLDFSAVDELRFPALSLARQVARAGGTAPAIMNAANEVAVDAFLRGALSFVEIITVVKEVLDQVAIETRITSLEQVMEADRAGREMAQRLMQSGSLFCSVVR